MTMLGFEVKKNVGLSSESKPQQNFSASADLSIFVMSGWPSKASVVSISFFRILIARVTPAAPFAARP
jgi:hypothetical protein